MVFFNSEYNHYVGVITSLKWFYLPRKSLDLVITHPKEAEQSLSVLGPLGMVKVTFPVVPAH